MIRVDGLELMTSEAVGSEEAFVGFGLDAHSNGVKSVLIGGLGLGFTLGEVCRRLPQARVDVVEISASIISWLRGPASNANSAWLDDPAVHIINGDLLVHLENQTTRYDLILLDIDNGPEALVQDNNSRLYETRGLSAVRSRLAEGGVAVFWSAIEAPWFEERLAEVFGTCEPRVYPLPDNPRVTHHHFIVKRTG